MNNQDSEYSVLDNEYTPIAYTAAMVALSTHTHPIQALKHVFSCEDYLCVLLEPNTSEQTAEQIVHDFDLPIYSSIGDLSEDPQLVGYLESLSTAIYTALNESGISLQVMNQKFDDQQVWETMACVGKAWVANGIEWTVSTLKEKLI